MTKLNQDIAFHLPTPRKGIETRMVAVAMTLTISGFTYLLPARGLKHCVPRKLTGTGQGFTYLLPARGLKLVVNFFAARSPSAFHLPTPRKGIETRARCEQVVPLPKGFTYLLPARGLKQRKARSPKR